jgi:RNA polymerase sigma-70 factor, ECF subfamily
MTNEDRPSMGPDPLEILRGRVVVAVRRTCPASLAGQAEDIVQNVMVQLVASGHAGEGKRDLSPTYLAKAAYGVAVDELRRRCRRREDRVDDPRGLDGFAGSAPGPERATASAEIARGIHDCLERLVRARRLAVTLYLEGCSVPEAAGLLRFGGKKTENLVYRGLADLRECLRGKGLEP